MSEIDVAQQWRELQELYAGMSEEELEATAEEGYELTDIAKKVLLTEIARRGLKVVVRMAPAPKKPEVPEEFDDDFNPADLDLRIGCTVYNSEQAAWVKKTLNEAGIPCFFGPKLAEEVDGLQFRDDLGLSVQVLATDLNRVIYGLRTFHEQFPSDEAPNDEVEEAPVRCPKCRSTEVVFQGLDSEVPENGDARTAKYNWSCVTCGHEWQDDGVGSES